MYSPCRPANRIGLRTGYIHIYVLGGVRNCQSKVITFWRREIRYYIAEITASWQVYTGQ